MAALPETAAFCIAVGDASVEQARRCRATFKLFHPEIPFYILDENLYLWFTRQREIIHAGEIVSLRSIVGATLAKLHPHLLYLDADVLVLGPLTALLESPAPLTVTADTTSYGLGEPVLNAGVLAARGEAFWHAWMQRIYSQIVPILGNFLDQLSLRELCMEPTFPHHRIPEGKGEAFYNLSYWEHPGEWRVENGVLHRGDAEVRLWHFGGGKPENKHWDKMPPEPRALAQALLGRAEPFLDYAAEAEALEALLAPMEAEYLRGMEAFFRQVPTRTRDDLPAPVETTGLLCSDAPASWDQFRNLEGTGFHRRLLAPPPRFIYAQDPARLERLDLAQATLRREWAGLLEEEGKNAGQA
ncbi:MAG: hypothetical protein PW734_08590 [Verrucomicrobium sp.]|nr:hypothetical protein [Verrucomicrobium sp.]